VVRQPEPEIEIIIDDDDDLELIDYEEVKPKRKRRKKPPEFDIAQTKQIVKTGFKAGEAVADLVFDILTLFL
jgi:hypothetical protein